MAEERSITQEQFSELLNWLDADNESAALKYESIRRRLIRVFSNRGCHEPEILTDRTFDRVTLKVGELNGHYFGDPAAYFHGVANNIHLEWLRTQRPTLDIDLINVVAQEPDDDDDSEYRCLESCLAKLAIGARETILDYYRDAKRAKIERRKLLAASLGITMGALQIRASRIRATLLDCVRECAAER